MRGCPISSISDGSLHLSFIVPLSDCFFEDAHERDGVIVNPVRRSSFISDFFSPSMVHVLQGFAKLRILLMHLCRHSDRPLGAPSG